MPYKVADNEVKVTLSALKESVDKIISGGNFPDIMNISLDDYVFDGSANIEKAIIESLVDAGVTVCVSSGCGRIPASYCGMSSSEKAIVVSAYDATGSVASFLNYGSEVDIAAPGRNLYSVIATVCYDMEEYADEGNSSSIDSSLKNGKLKARLSSLCPVGLCFCTNWVKFV